MAENPDNNVLYLDSAAYPVHPLDMLDSTPSLWWKLALPNLSLKQDHVAELEQQSYELERRNHELELLNEATQALHAALELDQVLRVALDRARLIFDLECCAIWLVEEQDDVVCRAVFDPLGQILPQQRLKIGEGIAGGVVQSGESYAGRTISSLSTGGRYIRTSDAHDPHVMLLQSVACVPLALRGKVLGAFEVTEAFGTPFTPSQLAMLQSLATTVAVAIDHTRTLTVLQNQKAELEVQNRDLEAFAHTVAHDLKGSINLITGFAYLLQEKHTTFSGQELEICVDALARGGYRLGSIIDELLLLAQVRTRAVQRSRFSMAEVVSEAQHRLSGLANEYQAQITVPNTWPEVIGYAPWVEEVWVNYMSNAIKYGGNSPRVELGATRAGDEVRFWVRDSGRGLTAQEQGQLFVPFTRLNQARTEGHGLGLSIVRRIMEELGGEVGVESRPGQGCVFYFTLPSAE